VNLGWYCFLVLKISYLLIIDAIIGMTDFLYKNLNRRSNVIIIIIFLVCLISLFAYKYYTNERNSTVEESSIRLKTIASLKAERISKWYEDELRDAETISRDVFLINTLENWYQNRTNENSSEVEEYLSNIIEEHDYYSISICSRNGGVLVSSGKGNKQTDENLRSLIKNAININTTISTGVYKEKTHKKILIGFISPIHIDHIGFTGVIVFEMDPEEVLFPVVDSWPFSSGTSETLLLKRIGDKVLYVNKPAYEKYGPLELELPINSPDKLAVKALQVSSGIVEGIDYRGGQVLAYSSPVPGTPWYLVTKVDKKEIFNGLHNEIYIIATLGVLVILLAMTALFFLISYRQRNIYRELLRTQEEYRTILYSIGDAVISTDSLGKIMAMNYVAEELTGWTEAESLGKRLDEIFNIIDERTRMKVENTVEDVLEKGVITGLANHTLLISRGGREIPIADSGSPIRNEKGEIEGVVIVFMDQTVEREASRQLKESEERLSNLMSNLPGMVYRCKNDEYWTMEFVSDGCYELTGYSPDNLLNNNRIKYSELVIDDELQRLKSEIDEAIKFKRPFKTTYRIETADGSEKWVYEQGMGLYSDSGELTTIEGFITDITDRKMAEEALFRSQGLLESILDSLSEAVFLVNPDDRAIELCNRAACRMFGYEREEIIGNNTLKLHVDRKHYDEFGEKSHKIVEDGQEFFGEFVMKRSNGEVFPTENEIYTIRDAKGWNGGVVSVIRDISEQKKAEEEKVILQEQLLQAQKMESVGRLAGGVAHDFNNILQAILGYVELAISKTGDFSAVTEELKEIRKATLRSADLTSQLLAFARKQTVSPETLDLNETISGMLKMLRRLIGEEIQLIWIPDSGLWPVKMDPAQIDQILVNLCVNAHDSIEGNGSVTVETRNVEIDECYIFTHPYFIPGEYVLLSVTDDGCGMEKEILDHIFEPFYTTKTIDKGTGLGMAMVYGIVKQNNGFTNIYSEPKEGTTVKIYFPRKEGDISTESNETSTGLSKGNGETILIVEDEPAILEMGRMVLEELGYKVLTAEKPENAIQLVNKNDIAIDLLITDVIMPGMDGQKMAVAIREKLPDIRCLFMSGYTFNVLSEKVVLEDNEYFIQKPFTVQALSERVNNILSSNEGYNN